MGPLLQMMVMVLRIRYIQLQGTNCIGLLRLTERWRKRVVCGLVWQVDERIGPCSQARLIRLRLLGS